MLQQQASDERAQSRLILSKFFDNQTQQVTSTQPPPPPDPFGGAIGVQSAVRAGFEDMGGVLRGFREDLTDIARQHARSSAEAQTTRNIQSMVKGVEVDVKRHPDQQSIQDAVAQGVSNAVSRLQAQPDVATLKGIEQAIAELSQRIRSIEQQPPPTLTQPNTRLRAPALVKEGLWDANQYQEQQAAMGGVVKPVKTPAELYQEQFAIEEGAQKRKKMSPSLATDDVWATGGAAQQAIKRIMMSFRSCLYNVGHYDKRVHVVMRITTSLGCNGMKMVDICGTCGILTIYDGTRVRLFSVLVLTRSGVVIADLMRMALILIHRPRCSPMVMGWHLRDGKGMALCPTCSCDRPRCQARPTSITHRRPATHIRDVEGGCPVA